jgi:hypothetical protein
MSDFDVWFSVSAIGNFLLIFIDTFNILSPINK